MPLINPPESTLVHVDHLHTILTHLRAARNLGVWDCRPEVLTAASELADALRTSPFAWRRPVAVTVPAEPLWWILQAAEEVGDALALPPVGSFYRATDELSAVLVHQAARTCRGLEAVLEADIILAVALRKDSPGE